MKALKINPASSGHYSRVKDPFYHSKVWRKFSRNYLDRNPNCVDCLARGIVSLAVITDHIRQRSKGGPDFPPDNGLRGLCRSCDGRRQAIQAKRSRV